MSEGIEVGAAVGEGVHQPIPIERAEQVVLHVLEQERVSSAEISIAFVGDDEIARLNEGYLDHAGATDVISFALHADGERPLGDVYVGVEQAARQAAEFGVTLDEELLRLTVHGTLHVLGYDHSEGEDRDGSPMYRRQEELLASYLDRIGAPGR